MNLSFERVKTWEMAQELLTVRNACRQGMTGDTKVLNLQHQRKFFEDELVPARTYVAYLLYAGEVAIGYGILRKDGVAIENHKHERCWMTAGLTPEARGLGLSRIIIALITQLGYSLAHEVWIEVYDNNLALRGDIREGYEMVRSTERKGKLMHVMKHRRDRELRGWERTRLDPVVTVEEVNEVDAISRESYAC